MGNVQTIRDFMEKHPENSALAIGDDVDFLYINTDETIMSGSGVLWQMWKDNSVTVVFDNGFKNVNRYHVRKALTDS